MKTRHRLLLVISVGLVVLLEVATWALPVAWRLYPSWVAVAVVTSMLAWPRSGWYALGLGFMIDVFAPAPFGLWMAMLFVLSVTCMVVKTSWVKQLSVLSVFVSVLCGVAAASVPIWIWDIVATQTTVISAVSVVVPWWQWPLIWISNSLIAALLVRLLPSPYERFV